MTVWINAIQRKRGAEAQRAIQSSDIDADEFGRLYLIDRWGAGMRILEYTG